MGVIHQKQPTGFTVGWPIIAHEYFHILQGMLVGGSRYVSPGTHAPHWLVEGHAFYADYLYSQDEEDGDLFLLAVSDFKPDIPGTELGDLNQADAFWDDQTSQNGKSYVYSVGLAAAQYLGDPAYLEFWRVLGQGVGWKEALRQVSGVGFDEFNRAFKEWLPSHIPQPMFVSVEVNWPGMGSPALKRTEVLVIGVEWVPSWPFPTTRSGGSSGQTSLSTAFLGEPTGKGYVCLKWDGEHDFIWANDVVGWYADGKLVSREDAELIEFTGESIILKDWSLPGHPDTLQVHTEGFCN